MLKSMADQNPAPPVSSRVFLACVPRSISTSITKCLSALDDDHEVWFEPYVSCRYAQIEYKLRTGKELPVNYEGNEKEYERAAVFIENQGADIADVDDLSSLPAPASRPETMSYPEIKKSLDSSTNRLVIVKDMGMVLNGCFQYLPSVESGYKYIFLIRDPFLAAKSFRRALVGFNKKNHGVVDESAVDLSQDKFYAGGGEAFRRLHELWCYVRANIDPNPLVLETEDLLAHPEACVRKICEVIGWEYSDALLTWEPATSGNVNTWMNYAHTSMGLLMKKGYLEDFHSGAMSSTGFASRPKAKPNESELTPDVVNCAEAGMKYYKEMYEQRFVPE